MKSAHQIVAGLTTKADKIRALGRAGVPRTEIARFLGISYQHVRNTLVQTRSEARNGLIAAAASAAVAQPRPMRKLLDAGFQLLGDCSLSDAQTFGYSVKAPSEAGVYAFAVDGRIRYVGLTRGALRTRLGHYVYGHKAQRTSARVKGLILEALRAGRRVQVLVASPPAMDWNGLPVDGAAGLETGLIRMIKPDWNQQGNKQ